MSLKEMRVKHVLRVLLLCFLSFLFGQTCKKKEIIHEIERDTVIDTVIQPIPVPQYVVDIGEVEVPVPLNLITRIDTIRDTVFKYIKIPMQQKAYETDDYRAVISGYMPNLDTMVVYHKKEIIYEKRRRWGLGLVAGYGVGKHGLSPYIGAGAFYRIW